ncbi:tyrosine kinase receptor Cad96Ca-like [Glandiceps talaboti]
MQTQRTTMNGSIYENIRTSIGTDDTSVSDTPYEVIPLGDINPYEDAASTDIFPQQIEQPYMKPGQRVFEVQRQNTHLTAGGIMDDVFHIIVKAQAWFVDGKDGATTVLVKKAKDHLDKSTNQNIKEEIDFLKSLPIHDNVIRMIACCTNDGGPPFLIMEYAVHGNLKDVLHKDNKSRMHKDSVQNQLLMYVIDVAKGMNHLSNLKVVHRYLAAKHVLVCDGRQCKISNFGYSRGVIESNKMYELLQGRFPYQWMAPEVLSKQSFSVQSDVWSLGVVAWEIFSKGCEPFEGLTEIDVTNRVLNGNTLERPKHCPEDVYLVVSSCWKKEPNERNSFNTIVEELLKLKKKCSKVNNGGVYTL